MFRAKQSIASRERRSFKELPFWIERGAFGIVGPLVVLGFIRDSFIFVVSTKRWNFLGEIYRLRACVMKPVPSCWFFVWTLTALLREALFQRRRVFCPPTVTPEVNGTEWKIEWWSIAESNR